tara:strand:- start:5711 stop:6016 length:306 start_codon:yes stop_codon:yes gene_type:complete
MREIIYWDIYEINTETSQITGVMFRGRIRKFCLERERNVLVENVQGAENVRFAVPASEDPKEIIDYLKKILPDVSVDLVRENVANPVLSRLQVNIEDRYTL